MLPKKNNKIWFKKNFSYIQLIKQEQKLLKHMNLYEQTKFTYILAHLVNFLEYLYLKFARYFFIEIR
jgi:hypothetical protein